jgi:cell division protein ZapA (FtsZ GTPase activity inhibitor)
MKSIEIEILGKKYFFKSDEPERLTRCAEYLKTEMEEFGKKYNTINQNKLYVLYSLTLTEKLFDEIDKNKKLAKEIEQINVLLKHIEE